MNRRALQAWAAIIAVAALLCRLPASAMTIAQFRKFTQTEQGTYIGAAISMLSFSYAASGDPIRARCIQNWYFGKKGVETPGPRDVTVEIAVAERLDPEKYHVEGVILGLTEKTCGAAAGPSPKAKP